MKEDYEMYTLGDFKLQSEQTLPNAFIAYKTYGALNTDKSNAIVYPTWFAGQHSDNEWLIGEDKALDPNKYFIIVPNMFGNGLSSSPSNTPAPFDRGNFPIVTVLDNVRAQYQLITEKFGIRKVALVVGWSLGALQTFQWGASYPEMVERIAPFGGPAKTRPHAQVMLQSLITALQADANWNRGFYDQPPTIGISAMGRVYAPWGFSQAYYAEELYQTLGFPTLDHYLKDHWDQAFQTYDANDLIAMLRTGIHADISANPVDNGNFEQALSRIAARAYVMPGSTDLFFPPEDSAYEVKHMPNADFQPIVTKWGHCFGIGLNAQDSNAIDDHLRKLLKESIE